MTPILYGHPFASFVWKPLIALYERNVAFTFRIVDPDHPDNQARIAELSPTGQFPALVDGDTAITQSNSVIEYLDLFHGDAAPMVPGNPRAALEARMMTDVFDDYVQMPMQRIVGDALRAQGEKDPRGVADAHAMLDRCYAWLDRRLQGAALGGRRLLHDRRLCCGPCSVLFRLGPPDPEASRDGCRLSDTPPLAAVRRPCCRRGAPLSELFPVGSPRQGLMSAREKAARAWRRRHEDHFQLDLSRNQLRRRLPIQCPVRIKKATSILQSDVGQVALAPGVQNLQ